MNFSRRKQNLRFRIFYLSLLAIVFSLVFLVVFRRANIIEAHQRALRDATDVTFKDQNGQFIEGIPQTSFWSLFFGMKDDEITRIVFDRSSCDADHTTLRAIGRMTSLNSLRIGRCRFVDLSSIRSLKNLKFLSLESFRGSDLSPLENLPQLERLILSDTPATSIPLEKLEKMVYLGLYNTQVEDLTCLNDHENLSHLSISGNKKMARYPQRLPALKSLFITEQALNDPDGFSSLPSLEHVMLQRLSNAEYVGFIGNCKLLKKIELRHVSINSFDEFVGLTNLKHLVLDSVYSENPEIDFSPFFESSRFLKVETLREGSELFESWKKRRDTVKENLPKDN